MQKSSFLRAGQTQAKAIREGLLGVDILTSHPIAKVHRSSWEPLALMNEQGLITISSQDSLDDITGRAKDYERSYVIGYMLTDEAEAFVERFNLWTDGMAAFTCLKVPDSQSRKLRGARITVTVTFDEERGGWTGGMPLTTFVSDLWEKWARSELGIPKRLPITLVKIFDAKWGRPARSKSGLFPAIFRALDVTVTHSRDARHLPPPPMPYTEEESAFLREYWATHS